MSAGARFALIYFGAVALFFGWVWFDCWRIRRKYERERAERVAQLRAIGTPLAVHAANLIEDTKRSRS